MVKCSLTRRKNVTFSFKNNTYFMQRRVFLALALCVASAFCAENNKLAAQVAFSGNTLPVYSEKPAASTGLNEIFVLNSCDGVSMSYTAKNAQANVVWYKYGSQGGGFAEVIDGVTRNGAVTTLAGIIPNSGYIIEEGTDRTYLWVINYRDYYLDLDAMTFAAEQDCGTVMINVAGSGADMTYYTINGVPKKFNREMRLTYHSLSWDVEQKQWKDEIVEESFDVFKPVISVPAPYCNTSFTLSGDKLLRFWGEEMSVESDTYVTNAVAVEAEAIQEARENSNEKKNDSGDAMGGSAPVTITFSAYCTDAVIHKEWQMSRDVEFNNIERRMNEEEVVETFNEAGTYYWRFIGSNNTGDCSSESATYTVNIGTSSIECPNVFSPQSTEGVNDEWKVSYKSIVEFKCWIFNRWGIQVCELTDPSQGWDGRYKGKYVKSGTYYYVIQARGADGQDYNLRGDINIINYKNTGSSNSGNTTE